jgi:hypothetical protein
MTFTESASKKANYLSIKHSLELYFNPAIEKKSHLFPIGVGLLPNAAKKFPQTSAIMSKAYETRGVMGSGRIDTS